MTIEILYFADCPNYLPVVENVQHALQEEGASAEIKHVQLVDRAEATVSHFLGSPTVRINGVDVEPSAPSEGVSGLCCRTYRGGDRPEGAPSVALIRNAIRALTKPGGPGCCGQQ
jgi:hypothetical protein